MSQPQPCCSQAKQRHRHSFDCHPCRLQVWQPVSWAQAQTACLARQLIESHGSLLKPLSALCGNPRLSPVPAQGQQVCMQRCDFHRCAGAIWQPDGSPVHGGPVAAADHLPAAPRLLLRHGRPPAAGMLPSASPLSQESQTGMHDARFKDTQCAQLSSPRCKVVSSDSCHVAYGMARSGPFLVAWHPHQISLNLMPSACQHTCWAPRWCLRHSACLLQDVYRQMCQQVDY